VHALYTGEVPGPKPKIDPPMTSLNGKSGSSDVLIVSRSVIIDPAWPFKQVVRGSGLALDPTFRLYEAHANCAAQCIRTSINAAHTQGERSLGDLPKNSARLHGSVLLALAIIRPRTTRPLVGSSMSSASMCWLSCAVLCHVHCTVVDPVNGDMMVVVTEPCLLGQQSQLQVCKDLSPFALCG
jgi:hypothetical protein